MFRTVKQAQSQDIIRKHWQPAWKRYAWSADLCGDNLYRDAFSALFAYNLKQSIPTLPALTQKQVDAELRAEGAMCQAEAH